MRTTTRHHGSFPLLVATLLLLPTITAQEEIPLESRITSLGLFKNGVAVVERQVMLPADGIYRLEHVPEAVHGTLWLQSEAALTARATARLVAEPPRPGRGADLQEDLAGCVVQIGLTREGTPLLEGRVLPPEPGRIPGEWDREYQRPAWDYWGWWGSGAMARQREWNRFLLLEGADGVIHVDQSAIAYLKVRERPQQVQREREVLLLEAQEVPAGGTLVHITYLARGMAWAPSYRVTLGEDSHLHLEQKAVLRNELEDLQKAQVKLISGYPSIEFSHVRSPLAPGNDWSTFFRELQRRMGDVHAMASNVMTQSQGWSPDRGGAPDLDLVPGVEGVDIHYQDIGIVSLREGESLLVPVIRGAAPFERVVEWIIPDTRDAQGRHRERNRWSQEEEPFEPEVWDAVRFRNPLSIPMTTAPAMVLEEGRFRGQRLSTWVNPGDETTLRITKALSIHTLSSEREEEGARDLVRIGGYDYRRTRVRGELQITSYRAEPVKLLIRRQLSGEVLEADGDPRQVLREEGATSVNPRTELRWELELAPREERTFTYFYRVRVRD